MKIKLQNNINIKKIKFNNLENNMSQAYNRDVGVWDIYINVCHIVNKLRW